MSTVNEVAFKNFLADYLRLVYVKNPGKFKKIAKAHHESFESVAAAGLVGGIASRYVISEREPAAPMTDSLAIAPVPPELRDSISALVRSASTMNLLVSAMVQGDNPVELLEKHQDLALLAERVVGLWRDHLGIEVEDMLDSLDAE